MTTLALGLSKEATQTDVLARLTSILAELAAALDVNVQNFPASFAVNNFPGATAVNNFPAGFNVNNLPSTYNTRALADNTDSVSSKDKYLSGEVLADQAGSGAVLTFTFASPVDLVFVHGKSGSGNLTLRADPFGGTPSASQGIPSDDGSPLPLPITTGSVKVFAPSGMTISVWGYRY